MGESVIRGFLGVNSVSKLAEIVFEGDGSETGGDSLDQLVESSKIKREDADAIVDKLHKRWQAKRTHVYDAYALIVCSNVCIDRHHVIFIRRDDGCFMCFD